MKERSEIHNIFEEYYKRVKVQLGITMKSLQLDGAKEYLNLKKRCEKKHGMECIVRIKKTPEQNDVAKRMIRTISEKIRCCLHLGQFNQELWAEAAITCVYVLNLLPAKNNKMVSPFKIWFKKEAPYVFSVVWHECILIQLIERSMMHVMHASTTGLCKLYLVRYGFRYFVRLCITLLCNGNCLHISDVSTVMLCSFIGFGIEPFPFFQ